MWFQVLCGWFLEASMAGGRWFCVKVEGMSYWHTDLLVSGYAVLSRPRLQRLKRQLDTPDKEESAVASFTPIVRLWSTYARIYTIQADWRAFKEVCEIWRSFKENSGFVCQHISRGQNDMANLTREKRQQGTMESNWLHISRSEFLMISIYFCKGVDTGLDRTDVFDDFHIFR